jgi:hypothetical protein
MTLHPEYIKEQEEELQIWRDESVEYINECLQIMRGFIPPFIFNITEQEDYAMNKTLAKRIFTKKCLWLIRMDPDDISKLHEAELLGRFNPEAQNLDIVELAAIYAPLPTSFYIKIRWRKRLGIEEKLKEMFIAKGECKLMKQKIRNNAYSGQEALFMNRTSLHTMRTTTVTPDDGNIDVDIIELRSSTNKVNKLTKLIENTMNNMHNNSMHTNMVQSKKRKIVI